jgi:hypothetical protein
MEEQALPDSTTPPTENLRNLLQRAPLLLEPIPKPGPDQCQVFYTVSGENGYSQQFMMLCPKSMDQNEIVSTLIRSASTSTWASANPAIRGKKTIRITQQFVVPEADSQIQE